MGLYFFLQKVRPEPVPLTIKEIQLSSLFPSVSYESYESKGWLGYKFGSLRILYRDYEDAVSALPLLIENRFKKYKIKREISMFEKGVYVLSKRSRGYIITAVFAQNNRIFWFDIVSHSNLDIQKDLFHKLLSNLTVNNHKVNPRINQELAKISKDISFLTILSIDIFIMMFSVIIVFSLGLVYLIFHLATLPPPKKQDGTLKICTRDITYTYQKGWKRNNSPACLCRENYNLIIYRFKKEILKIDLNREGTLLKRRKKLLIYNNYSIRIMDSDLQKLNLHHLIETKYNY